MAALYFRLGMIKVPKVGMGTYEVLCGELIPALQQQHAIITAFLPRTSGFEEAVHLKSVWREKVPCWVSQRKGGQDLLPTVCAHASLCSSPL